MSREKESLWEIHKGLMQDLLNMELEHLLEEKLETIIWIKPKIHNLEILLQVELILEIDLQVELISEIDHQVVPNGCQAMHNKKKEKWQP